MAGVIGDLALEQEVSRRYVELNLLFSSRTSLKPASERLLEHLVDKTAAVIAMAGDKKKTPLVLSDFGRMTRQVFSRLGKMPVGDRIVAAEMLEEAKIIADLCRNIPKCETPVRQNVKHKSLPYPIRAGGTFRMIIREIGLLLDGG